MLLLPFCYCHKFLFLKKDEWTDPGLTNQHVYTCGTISELFLETDPALKTSVNSAASKNCVYSMWLHVLHVCTCDDMLANLACLYYSILRTILDRYRPPSRGGRSGSQWISTIFNGSGTFTPCRARMVPEPCILDLSVLSEDWCTISTKVTLLGFLQYYCAMFIHGRHFSLDLLLHGSWKGFRFSLFHLNETLVESRTEHSILVPNLVFRKYCPVVHNSW